MKKVICYHVVHRATQIKVGCFLSFDIWSYNSKRYDYFHYMRLRLQNWCKVRKIDYKQFELSF